MRAILVLVFLFNCYLFLSAQSTREISGVVIDKKGNPIPNVRVEADGSREYAITDADGSFNIEVSNWLKNVVLTCEGYPKRKVRLRDSSQLFVKMVDYGGFISPVYSFSSYGGYTIGLMGGYLNNWGGYGKVLLNVTPGMVVPFATLGVTKRIVKNLHAYLGAGYTYAEFYSYSNYDDYDFYDALALDMGLIYEIKKLNFGIGYGIGFGDRSNKLLQISLGYSF